MKITKSKTLYTCEYCGKSHGAKSKAESCESACKHTREIQLREQAQREKLEKEFFDSESVSAIAEKLSTYLTKQSKKECNVVFKVRPNERCSNSHSSPRGKKTNWCAKDANEPTGYLGLVGELSINIQHGYCSEVSRAWDGIGRKFCIHTGCGGASGTGLAWDVTLWADDFPKIKEKLEEYFKLVKNAEAYSQDVDFIERDYSNKKYNFVVNHPRFRKQEEVVIEARHTLDTIGKELRDFFCTHNKKPESALEAVTQKDAQNQLNTIL